MSGVSYEQQAQSIDQANQRLGDSVRHWWANLLVSIREHLETAMGADLRSADVDTPLESVEVKAVRKGHDFPIPERGLRFEMGNGKSLVVSLTGPGRVTIYQPQGMQRVQLYETLKQLEGIMRDGHLSRDLAERGVKVTLYEEGRAMMVPVGDQREDLWRALEERNLPEVEVESVDIVAQSVKPTKEGPQIFWQRLKQAAAEMRSRSQGLMRELGRRTQDGLTFVEALRTAWAVRSFRNYFLGELDGINYGVRQDFGGFTIYRKISVGNKRQAEEVMRVQDRQFFTAPKIEINQRIPENELVPMLRAIRQQAEMACKALQPYGTLPDFLDSVDASQASRILGGFTPWDTMESLREQERSGLELT